MNVGLGSEQVRRILDVPLHKRTRSLSVAFDERLHYPVVMLEDDLTRTLVLIKRVVKRLR